MKNETLLSLLLPSPLKKSQITENLGYCTAQHPGAYDLLILSEKTRQSEAEDSPGVFYSLNLFHRVSGIYGPYVCGMTVKCFKTKNLQLQDLRRE